MSATRMRRPAACASFLTAWGLVMVGVSGQGVDQAALKSIVGHEKKAHAQTTIVSPPLTSTESKAALATIQALRRLLLETPALTGLRGHDWATYGHIGGQGAGHPLKLRLGYIAYPYFFNARMQRAESSAEGPPFGIYVNDPDVVIGQGGFLVDEDARFTFAPAVVATVDGYPVYGDSDRFIVITGDGRPLFAPVTQQQFLDLRISQARGGLESMKESLASLPDGPEKRAAIGKQEARLTALVAERSSMTEAQLWAPALDPDGRPTRRASFLAEPGTGRTRAIVMVNPALFDPHKPRTSAQVIVLGSIRYEPALYGQVESQIDKAALARLLD